MKAKTMDYFIPFPEEQPDKGKLEEYSEILMKKVAYPFPKRIKSEAGKIVLTLDFLMTWSGERIGELFHLDEEEKRTMVSIRWMMDLVPKNEMTILDKELHDEGLIRIYEEVKTKYFEKVSLQRWKRRLE